MVQWLTHRFLCCRYFWARGRVNCNNLEFLPWSSDRIQTRSGIQSYILEQRSIYILFPYTMHTYRHTYRKAFLLKARVCRAYYRRGIRLHKSRWKSRIIVMKNKTGIFPKNRSNLCAFPKKYVGTLQKRKKLHTKNDDFRREFSYVWQLERQVIDSTRPLHEIEPD